MGTKMKATVFHAPGNIRVEEVPRPHAGVGEAVIRITLTTICGTDLHIVRSEYPVRPGLVIGHEPVGVIEELGEGLLSVKRSVSEATSVSLFSAAASTAGARYPCWRFSANVDMSDR